MDVSPLRLNIGGKQLREGWKIYNIQPGPCVDYVGNCTNLGMFGDGTVSEIYASHVYEHLSYTGELEGALREAHRVLIPDGLLHVSVPDLDILCQLFLDESLDTATRFRVMRMMFGAQLDEFDFHKTGLNFGILASYLYRAGFRQAERVERFGIIDKDGSTVVVAGRQISLNITARKTA